MNPLSLRTRLLPPLILGALGGALIGGRSRRSVVGALTAIAGLALVGVAAHRPAADALRRAGTRRRSAQVRLSFVVPQSVTSVFKFCSNFENYPRFIGALQRVHDYGDGRSHWVGWTPTGDTLEWDAVTIKYVPNRVIAWQSIPSAPVRTTTTLRFAPERDGGTSVRVVIDYAAITGTVADAVVALTTRSRAPALATDIKRLSEHLELEASAPRVIAAS